MNDDTQKVLRDIQQKYYGKYRGFVADNADPLQKGRVRVRVPSVLGDLESGWALPCSPFGGSANTGLFMVPEIDAQVWVEFEEGNIDYPIWTGVFWQQTEDIPEEVDSPKPDAKVIRTPSGQVILLDDTSGEEKIRLGHSTGAELVLDNNGAITTTDSSGNTLVLDAQANAITLTDANGNEMVMNSSGTVISDAAGNKVEMTSSGINVEGSQVVIKGATVDVGGAGGEPLIKGQTFLSMFNSHTHNCTAPGTPSGPPIPPLTPAALTMTTKAK